MTRAFTPLSQRLYWKTCLFKKKKHGSVLVETGPACCGSVSNDQVHDLVSWPLRKCEGTQLNSSSPLMLAGTSRTGWTTSSCAEPKNSASQRQREPTLDPIHDVRHESADKMVNSARPNKLMMKICPVSPNYASLCAQLDTLEICSWI